MPPPLFCREIYQKRVRRVQDAMRQRELDVLLTADPANMYYLSAYDGWSFYVPQCVIVLADIDAPPIWWGRGIDAPGARRTVWMGEEQIFSYGDDYVHNPPAQPGTHLAETLAQIGGGRSLHIGYESETFYFTPATLHAVQAGLASATWHDAEGLINWQRAIKEEGEIECMRKAGQLVAAMHEAALAAATEGAPRHLIAAAVMHAGVAGVEGIWGDYPAIVPLLPAGADAAAAHLTWDDAPLAAGCGMFLELAGCYRRYHCPLARTVFRGTPPPPWRRAEAALQEGIEACLQAVRPGAVCGDIARALTRTLKKHQFEKNGRCGYSIGIGYPPDWGERTMSFRPQDDTPLAVGMAFHLMPALWQEDWGIEISESIVVTEDGCMPLAQVPRCLFTV